ncbi:MAG: hypothetical protein EA376_01355 [Phycisphaeraceae bacterium]|nr:MAG: hypothetical protein EA376_01355 [Phycisphaeraceae bacterium]
MLETMKMSLHHLRTHMSLKSMLAGAAAIALSAPLCLGQASERAVFVANNGNLEGSVTSFTLNPDDSLNLVQKLVIGSRPNTQVFDPGTNAFSISISPSGRFLAVGHATSATQWEQLTIIEVHSDATMSLFTTDFLVRDAPLGLTWVTDELICVAQTGAGRIWLYRFDPDGPSLIQLDFKDVGSFTSNVIMHPNGEFIYAQDSSGTQIAGFSINPNDTLNPINVVNTSPAFPIGIGISPDGTKIYGGGGISNGGDKVPGAFIDPDTGVLTLMPGSPFVSPGASPKQVVISGDNAYAAVAHGTDATVRMLSVDQTTGALTDTGFMFDVGFQGSLGSMAGMDDLLFVTDRDTLFDGVLGLYSFTINSDGSLTQNGPIVDTTGIGPDAIAVWKPADAPGCPADLDGDGSVGSGDLAVLLGCWGVAVGPCASADLTGSGDVGSADLADLLGQWGPCP